MVKGYYKHCTGKWHSRIYRNGKSYSLGLYKTEEEAREVYLKAKEKYKKYYDEFKGQENK